MDREQLYNRINQRVDHMMQAGLENEAKSIYPHKHLNSLNTVGYKELFAYFDDEISREEAIELIKRNTRHYARKQLIWLRKDEKIHWFEPGQQTEIIDFIEQNLNQ
jgi:tRNA dimethylallyltransferase